jgi:hypothetical protein
MTNPNKTPAKEYSTPGHDRASFSRGVRAAIEWLHARAETMNDPHAKAVLNSAGFHLGVDLKHDRRGLPSSQTQTASEGSRTDLKMTLQTLSTCLEYGHELTSGQCPKCRGDGTDG